MNFKSVIAAIKGDVRAQILAVLVLALVAYLVYKYIIIPNMSIEQRIRTAARLKGMPANMQQLLVAQAKHETANFNSNAFKQNKNLYGYKRFAKSDYQIGNGITSSEGDPYAAYASIEDSVKEVCDWIKRRQKEGKFPEDLRFVDADQYAGYLKDAGYYGDSVANYTRGLKHYLA